MTRRYIAPLRSQKSLRRTVGRRAPKPLVLIACEGHTERAYFEAVRASLGLRTMEIAEDTGLDPSGLIRYIERRIHDDGPFEHIVCAFDKNSHAHFASARTRIQQLATGKKPVNIREAVSIPCVEYWFLLHYERTAKPFQNSAEVITHIQESGHIPNYAKADAAVCRDLIKRTDAAIANAIWLTERAKADGFDNPFTNVHEIIGLLRSLVE